MAKHADYELDPSRELIDWDVNVYCPEELDTKGASYWNHNHWRIAFTDYADGRRVDYDHLTFDLPEDFCRAIGLVDFANGAEKELDGWIDQGLDSWIGLEDFLDLYADQITPRLARRLSKLPEYREVALDRH